jgi:hypothetical protein
MVMPELVELALCRIHYWSYAQIIFSASFAGQGVLNKGPTFWIHVRPPPNKSNYKFDKLIFGRTRSL